ncbi:ubiquinol-cytochrome C reductase complex 14kD subunit-domain-containing protein [Infundibulicybe gibba]|nr:ubiquinol-cytochrome C reductase complex 14kD subunit-domain-containing protein [Infundibulicybe gibba]
MLFGPLGASLAPYVSSSRTLLGWIKPVANWYANASGYRKYGFKYDDLLVEERPDVQRALTRLTPREGYDRAYRLKRASQASVLHAPLPKEQWLKPEEDNRYLKPHVLNVVKEERKGRCGILWCQQEVSRCRPYYTHQYIF